MFSNSFKLLLPDGRNTSIDKKSLIKSTVDTSIDDVLDWSKNLLGIPYLWGGKSSFGYDCSGFIQSLFSLMNLHFPRDTKEQVNSESLSLVKSNNSKRGDLIYFIGTGAGLSVASCLLRF